MTGRSVLPASEARAGDIGPSAKARLVALLLAIALAQVTPRAAAADELLVGTARGRAGSELTFILGAQSRRDLVGGRIVFDGSTYEISRVSRHGLVGAARHASGEAGPFAEFVVFSSSHGAATAVGQPWVAAHEYYACDVPYNAFIARYRVSGEAAVEALGPIPYPALVEDVARSSDSTVHCFMSRPARP